MANWVAFVVFGVLAYLFISMFGHLGGGNSPSAMSAAMATFRPIPFLLLVAGNLLWGVAVFFGFRVTNHAIPVAIAVGLVVSTLYSIVVLESTATLLRVLGLIVVVLGIYLIR